MCEALCRFDELDMIQTMFLCAGLGTRLLPLTDELPKPMVPLGDAPMLAHLLTVLESLGGTLRAVNTHHRPEKIISYIDSLRAPVHVSHEVELLGTAGGVRAARGAFSDEPLLVWNADILTKPPVASLHAAVTDAALALAFEPAPAGSGNLGFDGAGRIVRIRRTRIAPETAAGNYIGILAMNSRCFDVLPERGCLIGDLAIPLMQLGELLRGVPHHGRWSDIGTLRAYRDENLLWLAARGRTNWVGESAHVGADVVRGACVIGAGAKVLGEGRIEGVVVWPGAECRAPLADAIVTVEHGTVRIG